MSSLKIQYFLCTDSSCPHMPKESKEPFFQYCSSTIFDHSKNKIFDSKAIPKILTSNTLHYKAINFLQQAKKSTLTAWRWSDIDIYDWDGQRKCQICRFLSRKSQLKLLFSMDQREITRHY